MKEGFAKRLYIQRDLRNMSIREFANFLGVRPTTYSNWESGISVPKLESISEIADKLDVMPEYLVGWYDSPNYIGLSDLDISMRTTSGKEENNSEDDEVIRNYGIEIFDKRVQQLGYNRHSVQKDKFGYFESIKYIHKSKQFEEYITLNKNDIAYLMKETAEYLDFKLQPYKERIKSNE